MGSQKNRQEPITRLAGYGKDVGLQGESELFPPTVKNITGADELELGSCKSHVLGRGLSLVDLMMAESGQN